MIHLYGTKQNRRIHKQKAETDPQIQRTNCWLPEKKVGGMGKMCLREWQIQTVM